jgi:carbon storage regulator
MLVLTRKVGERLVLADTIVVTVLQIRSGQVRLGIEAPAKVPIIRDELKAKRSAATPRSGLIRAH